MDNKKCNRWLGFAIFGLMMALFELIKDDKDLLKDVSHLAELSIDIEDVEFKEIGD